MKTKALIIVLSLVAFARLASAQEGAKRQLVVPLAEGGFVAFKSETSWTDAKRSSTELQRGTSVLSSQAVMDDKHIIHRVLEDNAGRVIFGYDLLVASDPTAKQFKIEVRPLDRQYESRLKAEKANGLLPDQPAVIATFPNPTEPQMLDDGDAFSLDLLVNQNAGVKIVDVVRVTFNLPNFDINPRMMPRDFTLDAVELAMKDYRLLVDGNAIAAGKSANGVAGALLWFYVSDRGRFIFSLVPRTGYDFQKVGVIDENRIEFTLNGNHYEWLSSSPILPGGGAWNLWVLHDPDYTPIFGSDPAPPRKKSVLEKIDDVVGVNQTNAGIRNQRKTTLQVRTSTQTTRTDPMVKRPRVMIGGADRIENLWPKDP
ncbi:MAG TPA: hypothetical protein VK475_12680 [Pyrinomonadaceae bacterium]|nr:hypothetical protein [Pyrinomonadaceae bacterium]